MRLDYAAREADLITLISRDSDSFNRWQAAQTYASRLLLRSVASIRAGGEEKQDEGFIGALGTVIADGADPAFTAQMITLPSEGDIARDIGEDVDPDAIHAAREALRRAIGKALAPALLAAYARHAENGPYSPDAAAAGRRALRNAALDLYCAGDPIEGGRLALRQFEAPGAMTDEIAALGALTQTAGAAREDALQTFYGRHASEALVIDKWFALQAVIPASDTLDRIRRLMDHPAFSLGNPNRVRALIGAFAAGNQTRFNAADGSGYDFVADIVLGLDAKNPQVAARLLGAFKSWRSLEPSRRRLAEAALRRIADRGGLSADVQDIVDRSLG